jgi:hypothetical protein
MQPPHEKAAPARAASLHHQEHISMTHEAELALDRDVPAPAKLSNEAKRGLIAAELAKDPTRPNRAIAKAVGNGICHKTVAAARAEISPALVEVVLQKGTVSLGPELAMVVQNATDQCSGAMMRNRKAREAEANAIGETNNEMTLLMARKEVTIQHDKERGEWIIRQRNWPDEDGVIYIGDQDIHEFIDILTDHLGYGGPRP